jgi:uncharacterized protein YlxP (DUF503 family)
MRVAVLTVEIDIPGSDSLKDKRQVVRSLLDTIRRKFNVSAAEVDQNDIWRRATIGFAAVSNDGDHVSQVLDNVIAEIDRELRCEITNREQEIY